MGRAGSVGSPRDSDTDEAASTRHLGVWTLDLSASDYLRDTHTLSLNPGGTETLRPSLPMRWQVSESIEVEQNIIIPDSDSGGGAQ